jgi:endonuclease/exonuclease/phosphatase (EEP) superfamily protein YafD
VIDAKRTYAVAADGEVPAIEATIEWAGRRVRFLGLHTLPPTGPAYARTRDAQLAAVADWVKRQGGPVIVAGDLNATPWCASFRRLVNDTRLVNSQRGFGVQPTWPARGFAWLDGLIPIDHCLHSPQLVTVQREVGERRGSDHMPIVVTLRWAADDAFSGRPEGEPSAPSAAPDARPSGDR